MSTIVSFVMNITMSLELSIFKAESIVIIKRISGPFEDSSVEGCCSSNKTTTGAEMTIWKPFIC